MDEIAGLRLWIMAAHRDLDRERARLLRTVGPTPARSDALAVLHEHGVLRTAVLRLSPLGRRLAVRAGKAVPRRLAGRTWWWR